ncbi:MAG: hypothetical protein ACRD0K_31235, partial [Egibacteraceae bacterium]
RPLGEWAKNREHDALKALLRTPHAQLAMSFLQITKAPNHSKAESLGNRAACSATPLRAEFPVTRPKR